ncbi:endolytic transglycosylase MltG [Hutsoniella sourekii]
MNRQSLRSLGIGFLIAAILTGAFAIFAQGNSPMGTKVNQLVSNSNAESQLASQEKEIISLKDENASLQEAQSANQEAKRSLSEQSSSSTTAQSSSTASQASNTNPNDESNTEETPENAGEPAQAQPELDGSFEVVSGQTSSEIASQLEAEGFISSASEFQALIDEWGLDAAIQTGTYELNSDMSIHDIASIITNGAYYYY